MGMEEATYLACIAVTLETAWRAHRCNLSDQLLTSRFWMSPSFAFGVSFVLCISAILLDVKSKAFFKSTTIRDIISLLHAMDGVSVLILGIGLYGHFYYLTIFGILCLTKFFLLHMLSRMVTGIKTTTQFQVCVQTTKTFVHHIGSFLFLSHPKVILITTIWRCISMNGHAVLAMKQDLSPKTFDLCLWIVSYLRNTLIVMVLFICWLNPTLRRGFGKYFKLYSFISLD